MEQIGYKVAAKPLDSERLLKILLGKRVDVILANDQVMDEFLLTCNVKDRIKTFVNKDKPLGVYFSKTFLSKRPKFLT